MKKVFITAVVLLFAMILSIQVFAGDGTLTKVGQKVPEFKVTTLNAKEFSTKNLEGKVVLINFFATWCPPCIAEMPHLEKEIWQKYKNRQDFYLISIGREHKTAELLKFKDEKGFTFPIAADPKRAVYSLFAEKMIPRNYIIDKTGKIAFQAIGYTPEEFERMKNKLMELLSDGEK